MQNDVSETPDEQKNEPPRLIDAGFYRDLSNDDYHKSAGISSTSLKRILTTTPSRFLYEKTHPKPPTKAMELGTMLHELVLEPELAKSKYVAAPDFGDQRVKANREKKAAFLSQNSEKEIVDNLDLDACKRMAENINKHEFASLLLDGSINESSIYWWYKGEYEDERDYKLMCKVRPDAVSVSHPGVIADIKTTDDASYNSFARTVHNYSYHLSAAMHLDGANQCEELKRETGTFFFNSFIFIVVEKNPPYNVALYELSKNDLALGRSLYKKACRVYHDAKEADFPDFPPEVRTIELPHWAKNGHVV